MDARGNAYVTGYYQFNRFSACAPAAPPISPPRERKRLRAASSPLTKTAKLTLIYSTYLGGSGLDRALVSRWMLEATPTSRGSPLRPIFPPRTRCLPPTTPSEGSNDAFVSKLSFDDRTATLTLTYSTYLGGSGPWTKAMASRWTLPRQRLRHGDNQFDRFSTRAPAAHPNNVLQGFDDAFVTKIAGERPGEEEK